MRFMLALWILLLISLAVQAAEPAPDAFHYSKLLGRGINLGNALEAPTEGAWGMTLEADYFQKIKDAGFNSVRIPIRWSSHAAGQAPFTIDAEFFKRVDWAIDQALSRQLAVIINSHHYEELYLDPDKHQTRMEALWKQIAQRYRDRPDRLYFEILNEPHEKLTDARWNVMSAKLLPIIRDNNPHRAVIVGPGQWNNLSNLDQLRIPEADRHLIVTFHYYSPFQFTHQGAEWNPDSKKWLGRKWQDTPAERAALRKDFEKAAAWGKKHNRPMFLGEFGAYSKADMDSRARWTRAVAREAEKLGMSWAYWEFGSGFGAYDREKRAWNEPLLRALLDKKPAE